MIHPTLEREFLAIDRRQKTSWDDECKLISLPDLTDQRGHLSFVESNNQIPFAINRIYYLYDVPEGEARGSHAHRDLHQLMIALSGSFDVILSDGESEKKFTLNRPNQGLLIPPMTWRNLENFSKGAVCLVVASLHYSEADYIRDHAEFMRLVRAKRDGK